jgi:hypothetical protein
MENTGVVALLKAERYDGTCPFTHMHTHTHRHTHIDTTAWSALGAGGQT